MKDFNIAKYLKENHLGSHAILGAYVDLHGLKEEQEMELDTEIPYEGPEHKLDGFGDEFQQANPVEEANKDDKDSLMSKLFAIQKKYGYKKARPDQEEYENVRIAPTIARIGNKIVEDGGIAISIESKVSKAAFTDIKNLLQSKFPGWQIDPQSVTKDDDFDTDSKNVLFFDIVKNKSVKEANNSMDYDDSENPFPSIVSDEEGENEIYGRAWGLAGQQLKDVIDTLRNDGFDDEDIKNFLMTGIDMYDQVFIDEEVTVSSSGVQMEGGEEYTVDFGTNTMTYTLDRANSVLRGLKPGIVPGAEREEDIIPVTISPEGYLSTTDRSVKDISPKSNKNPFSDPSYRNID